MKKTGLFLMAVLLAAGFVMPVYAAQPDDVQICSIADEFTVVCPFGWKTSDSTYASTSMGKYVWLYLLWNRDTCVSISKEDFREKYGDFSLASASHRKMNDVYKSYLKDRPGSGSYKTTYLKTVYADRDWIPFFISHCVGSVYGATPKDDQLYYYYEAVTFIAGWRIVIMCYTNTSDPREDAGNAELSALEEIVVSFALQ
jgi:hypothetical protein